MTYIELINEFWRQDRFKPFNDVDTRFYFLLLNECNIRNWLNPLELQTQYLEAMLRIKRRAIGETRNRLKQRGLIDFVAKPNNPTIYLINNVEVCNDTLIQLFPGRNDMGTIGKQSGYIQETVGKHTLKDLKTEDLKEKSPKGDKKKTLSPSELISEYRKESDNDSYLKFLDWIEDAAPYVARNIKPQLPIPNPPELVQERLQRLTTALSGFLCIPIT